MEETQVEIVEVLNFMKEQLGNQAQEIAVLKATIKKLKEPTTNS